MGAGNVKLVYGRWTHLQHVPFRVLVWMALISLDSDDPPLFWGGRDVLAMALGRMVPDAADADSARERNAAFRAVRAATTALAKQGAISIKTPGAPGRNTVYALHLDRSTVHAQRAPLTDSTEAPHGPPSPDQGTVNGARSASPTVHAQRRNGARSKVATVHAQRAPEEEQEYVGLTSGMKTADLRPSRTGSRRPDVRDAEDDSSTAEQTDDRPACEQCGTMLDPDGSCFICVSSTTWAAR